MCWKRGFCWRSFRFVFSRGNACSDAASMQRDEFLSASACVPPSEASFYPWFFEAVVLHLWMLQCELKVKNVTRKHSLTSVPVSQQKKRSNSVISKEWCLCRWCSEWYISVDGNHTEIISQKIPNIRVRILPTNLLFSIPEVGCFVPVDAAVSGVKI